MELDDASTLRFNRGGGEEGRENGPRLKRCPAGRGGEGGGGGSLLMPFRAIYTSTTYSCIYVCIYARSKEDGGSLFGLLLSGLPIHGGH